MADEYPWKIRNLLSSDFSIAFCATLFVAISFFVAGYQFAIYKRPAQTSAIYAPPAGKELYCFGITGAYRGQTLTTWTYPSDRPPEGLLEFGCSTLLGRRPVQPNTSQMRVSIDG